MSYREEWKLFEDLDSNGFKEEDINSLINTQSKQTSNQLTRYLWFDLILKTVTLGALIVAVLLLYPNPNLIPLAVVGAVGVYLSFYQFQSIKKQPVYDYSQSTRVVISSILTKTRLRIRRLALLVSTTNPLIILAGSYLYLYSKYGTSLSRSVEDITVTLILMFIGFLINFVGFSIQQNSLLNDLEISNHALLTEDNSGLKQIARRRKIRLVTAIGLMIAGFIFFLLLLSGYFMLG